MMHEVRKGEIKRCKKLGSIPRLVTMSIKRNKNLDKNRYNEATSNEVVIVFVEEDGLTPVERDIFIYSRHDKLISIPKISKHTDPMTYPLIYLGGGEG